LTLAELMEWHDEPPYDFYDLDAEPLEASKTHVVHGGDGRVEAFWHFEQPEEGVVEIGIGLRPDPTGRGLGERYLRDELDYGERHVFVRMERRA
jgi:hypothetical protein